MQNTVRDYLKHAQACKNCTFDIRKLLTSERKTANRRPRPIPQAVGGAGTNLKVGGGHRSGAKQRKFFVSVVSLHLLALKVQLVVLVSAFVMVSTVWSVSCVLFYSSRCPLCPVICKSGGGTCPPCPMESEPLYARMYALGPSADTCTCTHTAVRSRGLRTWVCYKRLPSAHARDYTDISQAFQFPLPGIATKSSGSANFVRQGKMKGRQICIQGVPSRQKMAPFLYALTSSNIDRFLHLFRCQNQEKNLQ